MQEGVSQYFPLHILAWRFIAIILGYNLIAYPYVFLNDNSYGLDRAWVYPKGPCATSLVPSVTVMGSLEDLMRADSEVTWMAFTSTL